MTFIFDVNKEYHAGANLTDKFLCLETYSGLGRYSSDPDYPCSYYLLIRMMYVSVMNYYKH